MLDFCVEEIGADRVEELLAILREREAWLEERGMPLWDLSKLTPEKFFERYPGARIFLCLLDEEAMGGFALLDRDERYWPDKAGEKAYYLHKFVLKSEFSGRGFADKALEWAAGFAAAKGKNFLRLDYDEARAPIAALYARHRFKPLRVQAMPGGERMVLAERVISRS
jgi:GNAT superfamily N-acetyltransferase